MSIMDKEKMLSSTLYDLAKKIAECVKESERKKEIIITKRPYVKAKISDFKYEKGSSGFTTSFKDTFKEEWHWKDELDFIEKKIKQLDEYKEANQFISKIFKVSISQSDFWLSRFAHKIADEAIQGIDDRRLIDLITLFISDLEHNPVLWRPIVWLDGIYMETDVIEISNGCKIKRPEPVDLEYEISYESFPMIDPMTSHHMPSAIMMIEHRAKGQPEMLRKIEKIVTVLKLFKVGSISIVRTKWNPTSLLQFGGTSYRTSSPSATFKYELNKEDEKKLQTFYEKVEPEIPIEVIEKGKGETNFITIAFDRYNDSLLKQDIPESRLASAIMCLEALYLKDDERGELAERLSQRTALALNFFNYNSLEVFNILKKSYDIRSRFVHGSKIEKEEQKDLMKLAEKVIDYARMSIIMFLQIQEAIEKEKLISILNNSLLDDNARGKLKKIIEEKCQWLMEN